MVEHKSADQRGVVRKQVRNLRRSIVPGLQLPERQEDEQSKRDAYLLARANQHKPWARRWLQ